MWEDYAAGAVPDGGGYTEGGMVGCTQPRRAAAVAVAKRVAEEVGTALGDTVGYAIRFEDCCTPATRIRYVTDGVLLREAVQDLYLDRYSCVILDEAHERSLDTDLLLGVMKRVLGYRRDFRVIISSATLNPERFVQFFNGAPLFQIPGRTFKVHVKHAPSPVSDYIEQAVLTAMEIHVKKEMPGDILVFMTGQEDVNCVTYLLGERLRRYSPKHAENIVIIPVYSLMSTTHQVKMFLPAPEGKRKCVVATNIAETSLTIEGIQFVVDCGFCKIKQYVPSLGLNTLKVYPICQAQADQRAGRAGRTREGWCYRLYTENQYENDMYQYTIPEIQRTDMCHVLLLINSLEVNDIGSFPLMDAPPPKSLNKSMLELWRLKALDSEGKLTSTGRLMVDLPLDTLLAKFLEASISFECTEEAITISAVLSVDYRKLFLPPSGDIEKAIMAREKFFVFESDHLTLLNIYENYVKNRHDASWIHRHNLNEGILRQIELVREQLRDTLLRLKYPVKSCGRHLDAIRKALAFSHYIHVARRNALTQYSALLLRSVPAHLHPSSALMTGASMPPYVIYHEMHHTSGDREYMTMVSAVEPEWIAEAAPHLLNIRNMNEQRSSKTEQTTGNSLASNHRDQAAAQGLTVSKVTVHERPGSDDSKLTSDEILSTVSRTAVKRPLRATGEGPKKTGFKGRRNVF